VIYRLATRVGSGMVVHTIEAHELVVTSEKNDSQVVVPFDDITTVNLRQELPGAWSLRIERKSGSTITVPARHFVGVGNFELRTEEYRAFVEALHRGCATNRSIRYVTGSSGLFVLAAVLLVAHVLVGAVLLHGLMNGTPPPRRLWGAVGFGVLVSLAIGWQGRAKPYDPAAPPERFLPPRPE